MNRIVLAYIAIAYFITWTISLGSYYLYTSGHISYQSLNLVYNFGALGPFLAAWLCAQHFYKKQGVKKLFSALNFKKFNRRSLYISLSPIGFLIIGFTLYPIFTGHFYSFEDTKRQFGLTDTMSYISWLLPFITYAVLEEFGWRGFLLPHLQQRHTALKATVIITIVWACWHLPFFLWRFQFSAFITIGFFFSIFIGAILLTSAFNFSGGSLASAILFHFANNMASALDKEYLVAVISTGFVLLAVYIVRKYGKENLSNKERVRNFYLEESSL